LKKVQGKKKRDAEAAEALKRQLAGVEDDSQVTSPEYGDPVSSNLLSTKDNDVIF